MKESLRDVLAPGLVTLTRLEQPTLVSLARCLRSGDFHVFHFVGHGETRCSYRSNGDVLTHHCLQVGYRLQLTIRPGPTAYYIRQYL